MTSRDALADVAEGWAEDIAKEKVVQRGIMDDVAGSFGDEEVTVIKGVRRAGKTFILYDLLKKKGGIYVNFEDERLHDFRLEDFEKLMEMGPNILYLDEVQHVPGWEKFAHRAHRKVKLFVTGSNSSLLSSDYAKALVGRTKSFTVYPLDYTEFLRFKGAKRGRPTLMDYMATGGFPRIVLGGDMSLAAEYLDRIIYRDILATDAVRHPEAVKTLALYLLSNVGKEFSFRSLKDVCGIKSENTIKDYLGLLRDAYLVDVLNRFDPSLKVQESYGKKVYATDPSFVSLGRRRERDDGRVLENIVFLHLVRTSRNVFYGKDGREVDFIPCEGLKPRMAINVTLEAVTEKTVDREVESILHFQKKLGVPGKLVSLYPCQVPEGIEFHLAHRYLA
jgi:predicted AAA+ superfamily ATPase